MMYSLCPPMINPFIYCLRAKDMRESLRKQFKRRAVLKKAHVSAIKGNQSTVTEFILTGFPGLHPEYQDLVSAVLFFVYFLTMAGNVTILFLFATDHSLHKPMYYII
ncbi:hypothetical protein F7725_020531 [Dissostichus mawsoni]|uniref:Olfactory receptor n=1 Tax=Dissostichus mawsoni TaxID=36200 RepID=A0A7J5YEG1_DISMA|nr:hypothetical protein F7725_020531 [Dissostichus mawsoni]